MKLRKDFPQNIKNIFFDFGGVIMDIDLTRTIDALRALGVSVLTVASTQAGSGTFFDAHERGEISSREFFQKLRALIPNGENIPEEKIRHAWNALLGVFLPERIELLQKLSKNYRIFLLSNTNPAHREYFCEVFRKQFGFTLDSVFDKAFFSDELHSVKPAREIYERALAAAGVAAAESLFIDDNPANVAGAQAVGMHAYHLAVGAETILDLFEE
ncbi:MAG: HAD family phosphatase [Opitutae bacterium]|nr:HAD family phosphatase [Opitutae bacterium]